MVPSQDLIILGLLSKADMHGYEIKQQIEERLSDIARVSPGTVYYTLKKLEKQGLISADHSERQGNRPERHVYAITPEGRTDLRRMLSDTLYLDERPYYLFDVALYFFEYLDTEELRVAVADRLERVRT